MRKLAAEVLVMPLCVRRFIIVNHSLSVLIDILWLDRENHIDATNQYFTKKDREIFLLNISINCTEKVQLKVKRWGIWQHKTFLLSIFVASIVLLRWTKIAKYYRNNLQLCTRKRSPRKVSICFYPPYLTLSFFRGVSCRVPSQASRRKFMIYVRTGLSGETSCDGYLREYKDAEMVRKRGIPRKEQVRRCINLAGGGRGITASNLEGISLNVMRINYLWSIDANRGPRNKGRREQVPTNVCTRAIYIIWTRDA